jgi:ABC-2 type transport system permease protein
MSSIIRSVLRLLVNDTRIEFRELVADKWRTGQSLVMVGLFVLGLHVLALFYLIPQKDEPSLTTQTALWWVVISIMILTSLRQNLRLFSLPSDLDLLLTSPVSQAAVIAARVVGTAVVAMGASSFVVLPSIHAALLLYGRHFAFGYLVWLLLALIITASVQLAVILIASVTGTLRFLQRSEAYAAIGLTLLLFGLEFRSSLPARLVDPINHFIEAISSLPLLHTPARASQGDGVLLAGLVALALGAVAATSRVLPVLHHAGRLREGAGPRTSAASGTRAFASAPSQAILRKELRLIRRNPKLLSRTLPLILYALPLCFMAGRALPAAFTDVLSVYLAFVTIATGAQIAKITTSTDEGWDLVVQSPASAHATLMLRAVAALLVPLSGALIVALAVAALGRPLLAGGALVTAAICGLGANWIEVSSVRPALRPGVITERRAGAPITPLRILAAIVFVLLGPIAVGFLASDSPTWGLMLLPISLACCILVCALVTPDPA